MIFDDKKSWPVALNFRAREHSPCFGMLLFHEQASPSFGVWVLRDSPPFSVNQNLFCEKKRKDFLPFALLRFPPGFSRKGAVWNSVSRKISGGAPRFPHWKRLSVKGREIFVLQEGRGNRHGERVVPYELKWICLKRRRFPRSTRRVPPV